MGGLNIPKGMVKARWASSRLRALRTCGTRGGPARAGDAPGPLAEAVELALAQRPVDDDDLGRARLDGHGGVGHRRAGPPAAGEPGHGGVAELGQPQVGGHEGGLVAVVGERRQTVDVVDGQPGVGHGGQDGRDGQLVLAGVGDPAPLGVGGLADPDQAGAGAHRPVTASHGGARPLGPDLVGVLAEQRRRAVHDPGRAGGHEGGPGVGDRPVELGMVELDEVAPGGQVRVVEDLVGRPDHPPGQAGALAQPVQLLAVVLVGQPLERPPHLAVVLGPVPGSAKAGSDSGPATPSASSISSMRAKTWGPRKSGVRAAICRPSARGQGGMGAPVVDAPRAQVGHEVPLGHGGRALVGRDVDELAPARHPAPSPAPPPPSARAARTAMAA